MNKQTTGLTYGWWRRITSRIWRYDFFISYHWASGGEYAVGLAQRLRSRKFDCFLDRTEFAAGDVWVHEGRLALRHARKLIIIGTLEAITQSKPVHIEITLFTERNHQVIPICFGRPITELVEPNCATMSRIPPETIWIVEDEENLRSSPSQRVVNEIARSLRLLTSRRLRAIIVGSVITLLSIAVILVSVFAFYAEKNAKEALRQADIQRARRLTADSIRVGNDRKTVAVLLASHALGIVHRYGDSLPAAERVLRDFLPADFVERLEGLDIEQSPAPRLFDDVQGVSANSRRWIVQRVPNNPLSFHVSLADGITTHTLHLTDDGDHIGLTWFTFSDNSKWLVTEGLNLRSELWDLQQSDASAIPLPIESLLNTESHISPDSRWLATYGQYTGLSLWDLTMPNPTANTIVLRDHSELIFSFAFSRDSSRFATGSSDGTICLYSLDQRPPKKLAVLRGDQENVDEVGFSPSGRWLVTRDSLGKAVLWDIDFPSIQLSGIVVARELPHDANVFFSADHLLLGPRKQGDFKVVPLSDRLLLQQAADFVGRNLSHPEWDEFFPGEFYQKTFIQLPKGELHPEPEEIF